MAGPEVLLSPFELLEDRITTAKHGRRHGPLDVLGGNDAVRSDCTAMLISNYE